MVCYELLKVLAPFLDAQQHDNGLLRPIRSLKEVVKLKNGLMGFMGVELIHASRVEVPCWRSAHNIYACRSHECKVDGCVHLLHKA